tara:strand:- start:407 stop:1828 length:1422 start_codon:yes stop_codon:yes gene_type:complete
MRPLEFTKLVCTIGPSCDDTAILKKMIEGGLNIARLNLSHGDHQYHSAVIKRIRKISHEIAVMLDTKGPEIRTDVLDHPLDLTKNEILTLTNKGTDPVKRMIHQSHQGLAKDIKVGDRVLISDGAVQLKVVSISGDDVKCRVLSDCVLGSNKSVIIPGRDVSLPDLTGKDREDLAFGFEHDVDFIALSYVTEASTVKEVRDMMERIGKDIAIIPKIEHPTAVKNIDEIIEASDGIMVARGDLGLNISVETVPMVQKMIVRKANEAGKPVVVATQMLESMTTNLSPTRAEASDVANAILDGADAVMLSGETAIGDHPLEAVETMIRIIRDVDPKMPERELALNTCTDIPEAIAMSVDRISRCLDIKAIITPTSSGFTPNLIAKHRPKVPIVALSTHEKVSRRLEIVRGVFQFRSTKKEKSKKLADAVKMAIQDGVLKKDDLVVITFNHKKTKHLKTTNCLEIMRVSELLTRHSY